MKDELARAIFPIFSRGLELRERLLRGGEGLDRERERLNLLTMLRNAEANAFREYLGDAALVNPGSVLAGAGQRTGLGTPSNVSILGRPSADQFLGIRYALTCWLDEIIIDTPWGDFWKNETLEWELFRSSSGGDWFWDQVRRAERKGVDSQEAFFLCIILGFRGALREDPDKLNAEVSRLRAQITQNLGKDLPLPPELEPGTNVPPRRGLERLKRMLIVSVWVVLAGLVSAIVVMQIANKS